MSPASAPEETGNRNRNLSMNAFEDNYDVFDNDSEDSTEGE